MGYLVDAVSSLVATVSFAILFNIRGRNVLWAGVGGMIGWLTNSILVNEGISPIFALVVSSIVFSTYSEITARILRTPVTTLIICALIPLVPGGGMFYTMLATVEGDTDKATSLALTTIGNAGALAAGVIFVSTIMRLIPEIRQRRSF